MINRRSQLPSNNVGLLESWTSKAALVVKDPHADAGHTGDADPVLGSGRSPGGGHDNPLRILAWRILWTEETGRLQSMGSQRVRHD